MRLVYGREKNCVVASLAMLTGLHYNEVWDELVSVPGYPFSHPWDKYPKAPSMDEICDWLWNRFGRSLTPFNRDPNCAPDIDCPPVPVWNNGEKKWMEQLGYGIGLLESVGVRNRHMCAWNGERIFDPRGNIYSWENRELYNYDAERFWLWRSLSD